jgi:hypothetical protein
MVENKEMIFSTIKIIFKEINFSRGLLFLNCFALHKKSKNYGTRFSKILFSSKT